MGPSKKIVIELEYFSNWQSSSGRTWNDGHPTASSLARFIHPPLPPPLPPLAIIPRSSTSLLSTELVGLPRKINLSVFSACPVDSSTTPPSIPLSAVKAKIYRYHRPSLAPRPPPPSALLQPSSIRTYHRFTLTKCFVSFACKLLECYCLYMVTQEADQMYYL